MPPSAEERYAELVGDLVHSVKRLGEVVRELSRDQREQVRDYSREQEEAHRGVIQKIEALGDRVQVSLAAVADHQKGLDIARLICDDVRQGLWVLEQQGVGNEATTALRRAMDFARKRLYAESGTTWLSEPEAATVAKRLPRDEDQTGHFTAMRSTESGTWMLPLSKDLRARIWTAVKWAMHTSLAATGGAWIVKHLATLLHR